jgi:hypothetical protein
MKVEAHPVWIVDKIGVERILEVQEAIAYPPEVPDILVAVL